MQKDNTAAPVVQPEIDYTPKTHSLKDQLLFGLKLAVAAGVLFLLFWLGER